MGDSGYPLQPWLLTPFQNPAPNSPEERYNHAHKITRSSIERCIGILKIRFRCLLGERRLRYDPMKVGIFVNTCAILHNMCIRAGIELPQDERAENHDLFLFGNGNDIPRHRNIQQGDQTRQHIVRQYFAR